MIIMDEKTNHKIIFYENGARVYSQETFKRVTLENGKYRAASVDGNYVLVYTQADEDYLEGIGEQMCFESYEPKRSIEDIIFDDYESEALEICIPNFMRIAWPLQEDEIIIHFNNVKEINYMNARFNKLDANNEGAKAYYSMGEAQGEEKVSLEMVFRSLEDMESFKERGDKHD